MHRLLAFVATCWLLATAAGIARAQDAGDPVDDPPARAGRLALVEGSVSLQPAGLSDWNAAAVNQPLTAGDSLWSDTGSRAELDLGEARVRLDGRSMIAILDLSDRAVQLRLDAGSIDVAVSDGADLDSFEIDAPNAAVSLLRPGEYRLTVDNASSTSVVVRNGQVQVQTGDQQPLLTLGSGQRGVYGDGGSYAVLQAGPPDDFDRWCLQRQARWAEDQAVAQYVSTDAVGYQDLNDYGQWQQQPDDGYVWFPSGVADDWVPYSTGHWAWIGPWGWSWVDDAPWGFAPFHYGRWARFGQRWGWIPCPPHRRAIYAPALVAWIGGPGFPGAPALGGGAAVGWLPLAPGEVYVPGYRASPRYLLNVNLSSSPRLNPTLISSVAANPALQNRYANREAPGALTVVPQVNFTSGQPVERHRMSVPAPWQTVAPVAHVPAIAPERESVLGALTLGHVGTPPTAVIDRPVITRRTPPNSPPGFDRQQAAIQANGSRPLDAAQLRSLRQSEPIRQITAPAAVARGGGAGADTGAGAARTRGAGAAANDSYRGIPERAPNFQAPQQQENVFERRDREIEQEREAQQREQKIQQLQQQRAQQPQRFQSQEVQRLQEQQRVQEQQQQAQLPRQVQPQPSQPAATPRATARPDPKRTPEQNAPAPGSAR
jgi:hypothetical protein